MSSTYGASSSLASTHTILARSHVMAGACSAEPLPVGLSLNVTLARWNCQTWGARGKQRRRAGRQRVSRIRRRQRGSRKCAGHARQHRVSFHKAPLTLS